MQSILAGSFSVKLLRLSASICEVTASTAAAVVSHLERFLRTSARFGNNVQKAFLLRLRQKKNCDYLMIFWPKRIKIDTKKF